MIKLIHKIDKILDITNYQRNIQILMIKIFKITIKLTSLNNK